MNKPFLFFLRIALLLNIFYAQESMGQSYGLGFLSHEVEVEKRTSLVLFPEKGFQAKEDFQLSFDLSFFPDRDDYFGYILRIVENGQKNIDLMYVKADFVIDKLEPNHFKLVNGEQPSKISFNIDEHQIQNQWHKINILFDYSNDRIILYVDKNKYVEDNAHLNKKSTYKFSWGINDKNADCPPMKIRNVKIESQNKIKYFWPLNEINGNIAHEIINNQSASVNNPLWMRSMYRKWTFQKNIHLTGNASIAFNEKDAELYIIGNDSLLTYNINTSKLSGAPYKSKKPTNLPVNTQSLYNNYDHTLYNYYLDRNIKQVNKYDFNSKKWDKNYLFNLILSDYQNTNNFFSVVDTSLYIVGGYGHYLYKNNVHKYNTITKQWTEVKTKGDYYWPRYLAASGTTDSGSTAYFLGGYGSYTGKQIINPKNLYDLVKFDTKTKTFKKIYDLKKNNHEDFAFANSMIIDQQSKTFSALVFPNSQYNSRLKLLMGSLTNPSYQLVGDSIPYKFIDIKSFASLYYIKKNKQYIAVILNLSENNQTTASIYTLLGPPDISPTNQYTVTQSNTKYLILFLTLIVLAALTLLAKYVKRRKHLLNNQPIGIAPSPIIPSTTSVSIPNFEYVNTNITKPNAIFLFGDMQLITSNGDDIIKQFTPLLKELFLIILIHSLKSGRGITNEKLVEFLWPDKSAFSAKNNGYANLSRLKSLLQQVENISLSKKSGTWKIDVEYPNIYLDYQHYLQIVANRKSIDKENILQLIEITHRGKFLSGFEYPWLDQMKADISNEIIDIYLEYANNVKIEDDPEFLIKLSNIVFHFDSVNEEAMIIKCKVLAYLGKHSLAKSTFGIFFKEYKNLYGEEFKKDFQTILE